MDSGANAVITPRIMIIATPSGRAGLMGPNKGEGLLALGSQRIPVASICQYNVA